MKMFYLFTVYVLTLAMSCSSSNKNPGFYIDKYYNNEDKLNRLIDSLRRDTSIWNKTVIVYTPDQLSDFVQKQMMELNISDVGVSTSRRKNQQLDFTTKWQDSFPIHLSYNYFDSGEAQKGFYKKNFLGNEIWGLGNGWTLWIERKLLEPCHQ